MEKSTPLWCEDCRFVSFETGLGKPMLTLNDPNGFKNSTNVYSIHLELRMALPCQISTGKWKYVSPCLDFLGIPDQRTAYVKRQAQPRWTYVRRSSVTPDLITPRNERFCNFCSLDQVDDENHFLMACKFHSAERQSLLEVIIPILKLDRESDTTELFLSIMGSKEKTVLQALAKFVYGGFQKRDKSQISSS